MNDPRGNTPEGSVDESHVAGGAADVDCRHTQPAPDFRRAGLARDRIMAPATQAGSQTVIGQSSGSEAKSPAIILATRSQMVFGV